MTETPTAADLHIPEASRLAVHKIQREPYGLNDRDAALYARAVAAPVVAAELRRIANVLDKTLEFQRESSAFADGERDAWEGTARSLRARADELDPPTSKEA